MQVKLPIFNDKNKDYTQKNAHPLFLQLCKKIYFLQVTFLNNMIKALMIYLCHAIMIVQQLLESRQVIPFLQPSPQLHMLTWIFRSFPERRELRSDELGHFVSLKFPHDCCL